MPDRCGFPGIRASLAVGGPTRVLVLGNSITFGTGSRSTGTDLEQGSWPEFVANRLGPVWGGQGAVHGIGTIPCNVAAGLNDWTLTNTSGSSSSDGNMGLGYRTTTLVTTDRIDLNTARTGFTHVSLLAARANSSFGGFVLVDKVNVLVDGQLEAQVETRDTSLADGVIDANGILSAPIGPFDPSVAHTIRLQCANEAGGALNACTVHAIFLHRDGNDTAGMQVWNAARPSYNISSFCTTGTTAQTTRRTSNQRAMSKLQPDVICAQFVYNYRANTIAAWRSAWGRLRDDIVAHAPAGVKVAVGCDYQTGLWDDTDMSYVEADDALAELADDYGWTHVPVGARIRTTPRGRVGYDGVDAGPNDDGYGWLVDDSHPSRAAQNHLADTWHAALVGGDMPRTWFARQQEAS